MFQEEEHCSIGVSTADVLRSGHRSMAPVRCLIIDSNQTHQELFCLVMENLSLHPSVIGYSPETYQRIETERPALLVMDLAFGNCQCWQLLRKVQNSSELSRIPVVVLSTDSRLLERARGVFPFPGGVRFLQKPFDIAELERAVTSLLTGEIQD